MKEAEQQEEFIDSIEGDTQTETTSINSLEDAEKELDHEALAKFADESLAGGDPDDVSEGDVEQRDTGELPDDTKAADIPKPEEKEAAENKDAKPSDTDKAADNKDETKDETKAEAKAEPTPADVLARDGKHTIPYSVLEDTRKRLQQQETRNQELEAELEKAKTTADSTAKTDTGEVKLSEAEQAHIDRLREEYGDELADPIEASYLRNARLEQRIEGLQQRDDTTDDGADEESQIQAAIDASPVMAAWQARNDQWYQASQDVYQRAMQTDPEFRAKSIEERFQELPNRVQSAFGKDPNLPQPGADKEEKAPVADAEKVEEAQKAETDKAPKEDDTAEFRGTMSDIPGGATPEGGKFGPMDGASPQKIQQMLDEAAEKGNLDHFIDNYA